MKLSDPFNAFHASGRLEPLPQLLEELKSLLELPRRPEVTSASMCDYMHLWAPFPRLKPVGCRSQTDVKSSSVVAQGDRLLEELADQYPLRAMSRAVRSSSCVDAVTSAVDVWSFTRSTRSSAQVRGGVRGQRRGGGARCVERVEDKARACRATHQQRRNPALPPGLDSRCLPHCNQFERRSARRLRLFCSSLYRPMPTLARLSRWQRVRGRAGAHPGGAAVPCVRRARACPRSR